MATRRPLVLVGGELKELPAGDTMLSALLGATTVGDGLLKLPNPGSLAFLRINADNTVSALAAADFRSAIGAGTSSFSGVYSALSGRPTITGTANQVIVTNGDGAAGNPTLSLPQSIATTSTPLFAGVGVNGAAASFRLLQFYTGGVRRINVGTDGAGESGANAGSNFQINRFDDAGNSLGAALFIQRSTGNVGIGTTSPAARLDLGASTGVVQYIYKDGSANAGLGINLSGGYGELSLFAGAIGDGTGRISFGRRRVDTGTYTERMVIDVGTGNVGIGTTNPAATLDVAGSGRFGEAANPDTAYSNGLSVVRPSGTPTSILLWQVGKGLGHVGFKANDSTLYVVNSSAGGTIANGKGIWIDTIGNVRLNAYGAGTLVTDSSGNITATSDARMKDISGSFDRGLNAIVNLSPKVYHWNKESGLNTEDVNVGLIAQEVLPYIPEAVSEKEGRYTMSDRPIIAALVNAVQELSAQIETLKKAKLSQ